MQYNVFNITRKIMVIYSLLFKKNQIVDRYYLVRRVSHAMGTTLACMDWSFYDYNLMVNSDNDQEDLFTQARYSPEFCNAIQYIAWMPA